MLTTVSFSICAPDKERFLFFFLYEKSFYNLVNYISFLHANKKQACRAGHWSGNRDQARPAYRFHE